MGVRDEPAGGGGDAASGGLTDPEQFVLNGVTDEKYRGEDDATI